MVAPILSTVGLGLLAVAYEAQAQTSEYYYGGVAATVPGVIQAEEFDNGGEGVGYSDKTIENEGGHLRLEEAVDIDAIDGGYIVGWMAKNEYLRYSVDVIGDAEAFDFSFRVASNSGRGSLRIVTGGTGCDDYSTNLSGLVSVPNTGGWYSYEDVPVSGGGVGALEPGVNLIWLCVVSAGLNVDSFTMTPTATPTEGPYGGVAATVPGLIEAEKFDYGGEGVAYTDTSADNEGGAFRPAEAVDIEPAGTGYIVGWMGKNEYMRYTVDVTEDVAEFDFSFRVSSNSGLGKIRIVAGGTGCDDYSTDLSGVVSVPNTGGWYDYEDVVVSSGGSGGLEAGSTFIWLCVVSAGVNVDSFTMTASPDDATPSPIWTPPIDPTPSPMWTPPIDPTPSPITVDATPGPTFLEWGYQGIASDVPGLIEAEVFDEGGQGSAYSDTTAGNSGGEFRTDVDVDIKRSGTDYYIADIAAGEYLRYTVYVAEDVDEFDFIFRVSSNNGKGSFRVVAGGKGCDNYKTALSGLVTVPNTGGWSNFEDVAVYRGGSGGLDAGLGLIWLCIVSAGVNIDSFTMEPWGPVPPTPSPLDNVTPAPTEAPTQAEQSEAYGGVPSSIPGIVEAEEFDYGGEGVGYSDKTSDNTGRDFRLDEGVDVSSYSGGYKVVTTKAGEYLRYSVTITEDVEKFSFSFFVASKKDTGSLHVVTGGTGCNDYTTDLSGIVSVPNTGGWNNFQDYQVYAQDGSGLDAGSAYIWLCVLSGTFHIDKFTMSAQSSVSLPYGGIPASVPGKIEAEEFDTGGEGLAYSDSNTENKGGAFRPDEGVDIGTTADGYFVGWNKAGEYLHFTVTCDTDIAAFDFTFVVAGPTNSPGAFRIVTGGAGCDDYTTDLSGLVLAPANGGSAYSEVKIVDAGDGGLYAGETIITMCVVNKRFNLDSFTMEEHV